MNVFPLGGLRKKVMNGRMNSLEDCCTENYTSVKNSSYDSHSHADMHCSDS